MVKFLHCKHCGKVLEFLGGCESGCKTICCGEPMEELTANSKEAATEKHIPVVEINGNTLKVSVGSILHPMTEAHLINFVVLETDKEVRRIDLKPNDTPVVTYDITNEKPLRVYAYCNLHGLWVKEL